MSPILTTIIAAVVVVGFFALAMSLTYIFKGHHIQSVRYSSDTVASSACR